MKNILMFIVLLILGLQASAQLSDSEKIIGTWRLDSVVMEAFQVELSEEELELMKVMKSSVFMTFSSDSSLLMPDFDKDFNGEGDVPTIVSKYYLMDGTLHILLDDLTIAYKFINDNYLEFIEDGESMFFKRE